MIESTNTFPVLEIMARIKETAPNGARVEWQYPGYISIGLFNGTEIAFGESLEKDSGYSWNDFDSKGNNNYADSFDDLADIESIVSKLWDQTSHLLNEAI